MRTAVLTLLYSIYLIAGASAAEFKGHACTKDCSGHRAGYAWAHKKGITDPKDCKGRSKSFVEGCKIYAEERQVVQRKKTK